MPLQSVLNGAKQCQVISKRSKQRCKNPAAYGCAACRMHGAHKSRNVLKGKMHPNYKNGHETNAARSIRSEASLRLHRLEELGWYIQMFHQSSVKIRGRKPAGHINLDLNKPEDLKRAIIQSMHSPKK
jgi:hypothetical protein